MQVVPVEVGDDPTPMTDFCHAGGARRSWYYPISLEDFSHAGGERIVHFYRNVFSVVPKSKMKTVAQMLKAIHAQESKKAAREKARMVKEELKAMKLKEAAQKIEDGTFYQRAAAGCKHWGDILSDTAIWLGHTCPKVFQTQP